MKENKDKLRMDELYSDHLFNLVNNDNKNQRCADDTDNILYKKILSAYHNPIIIDVEKYNIDPLYHSNFHYIVHRAKIVDEFFDTSYPKNEQKNKYLSEIFENYNKYIKEFYGL